jgi:hypothetical protein
MISLKAIKPRMIVSLICLMKPKNVDLNRNSFFLMSVCKIKYIKASGINNGISDKVEIKYFGDPDKTKK